MANDSAGPAWSFIPIIDASPVNNITVRLEHESLRDMGRMEPARQATRIIE